MKPGNVIRFDDKSGTSNGQPRASKPTLIFDAPTLDSLISLSSMAITMIRPTTPGLLEELQSPTSLASQIDALKALKNEVVGHDDKKALWVRLGALVPVIQIIESSRASGKQRSRELNGTDVPGRRLTDIEEARLQAIVIVDSFARGGPAYIKPLFASSVISALLSSLSPSENPPEITLASLTALRTVADSLSLCLPTSYPSTPSLEALFTPSSIESLVEILGQTSSATIIQRQIHAVSSLIAKTCNEERFRAALASSGVLQALAYRLSTLIVSKGYVLPGAESSLQSGNASIPPAAPESAKLAPILRAIATIIKDSKLRALQLICSPHIKSVFPSPLDPWQQVMGADGALQSEYADSSQIENPLDNLLPEIPHSGTKSAQLQPNAFPPLGSGPPVHLTSVATQASAHSALRPDRHGFENDGFSDGLEEREESPLVAWLLHMSRVENGFSRLMSIAVLTLLYRAGLASKSRERGLALMVVPLLVRMLDECCASFHYASTKQDWGITRRRMQTVTEETSGVLAMLLKDSEELQKAAVDAHAIKKLAQLLKLACARESAPPGAPTWHADGSEPRLSMEPTETSTLGGRGLTTLAANKLRVREGVLMALASLGPFKEEYRKEIIAQGITPLIVDSLRPFDIGTCGKDNPEEETQEIEGNPSSVMIAACCALRSLSRSVLILRTTLVDANVAPPIFALLKHPDTEVKIAATAVTINLVLDFSPMREAILKAGVLEIMCDLAHSPNPKLRLNAVWALKHLSLAAELDVKVLLLRTLRPQSLVKLICENTENSALITPRASMEQDDAMDMSTLNQERENSTSIDPTTMFEDCRPEVINLADSVGIPDSYNLRSAKSMNDVVLNADKEYASAIGRTRLAAVLDAETNPIKKARSLDLAVQEQALSVIRNLMCAPGSPEMIDCVFRDLGQDTIFDILSSKLKPSAMNLSGRDKRKSGGDDVRCVPPAEQIIESVSYIIVHIAAGRPRHRQTLLSNPGLLKLLLPLCNHPNKTVRVAMVWVIINLSWTDDESDRLGAKSRAIELRNLGFLEKLESLENDPDLDVKERVKTALFQMRTSLKD